MKPTDDTAPTPLPLADGTASAAAAAGAAAAAAAAAADPAAAPAPDDGLPQHRRSRVRDVVLRGAVVAASTVIAFATITLLTSSVLSIVQPNVNALRSALATFSQWAPALTIVMTIVVYPLLLVAERAGWRPRVRTLAIVLAVFLALIAVAALIALLALSGEIRPFNSREPVERAPGSGAPELGWDLGLVAVIAFLFVLYAVPPIAALVGALTLSTTAGARWPRSIIVAGAAVVALAIGGSAAVAAFPMPPAAADSTSGSQAGDGVRNAIGSPAGVADVTVDDAAPGSADSARSVLVLMSHEATATEIHAAADDAIDAAARVGWTGSVSIARAAAPDPDQDQDPDAPRPQKPWTLQLVAAAGSEDSGSGTASGDGRGDESSRATAHRKLDDVMVIDTLGPGVSAVVGPGWPSVQVTEVSRFLDVFTQLNGLGAFADGATYSVPGESKPLRIVHVPSRITAEAVAAIVAIAVDHPRAEVLLQATTSAPQWPVLYIAQLSAEEATAVEAQLLSPALATADPDGYAIDFILTSGQTTLTGTLGNVQE